jgi:cytidyltransferase-like protein
MKIVLVTGGFDPLHSGHIAYFKAAKELGDILVVGINSDAWLARKKSRPFMPWEERAAIIKELAVVDDVIAFNDNDDTSCDAIKTVMNRWKLSEVVFANGGDRSKDNIPEMKLNHPRLSFEFAVGGEDKKNSSSWLLDNWKTNKTEREWGHWRVLDDKQPQKGLKVKELVIKPNFSLSNQKHNYRNEYWYLLEGKIQIELEWPDKKKQIQKLTENDTFIIPQNVWHKTKNIGETVAHILEVQYGSKCIESDIERK